MKQKKFKNLEILDETPKPQRKKPFVQRRQKDDPTQDVKRGEAEERLQKYLATLGLGSRREIETWITEGRLKVDGQIAVLGQKVTSRSRLALDGKLLRLSVPRGGEPFPKVLLYYKPEGEICTLDDPEGRKTVFQALPRLRGKRWIMVGRLDLNTMGLLLFTTNGELANRLMHPKYEIEREYAVRVRGHVTNSMLTRLRTGVELEDGLAHFDTVTPAGGEGTNAWYHVTLKGGKNREVRRLWESQEGIQVSRLTRVRFGNILLPREMQRGRWEYLSKLEVQKLGDLVKLNL
jgi:23S rRNA pseudouridine2605 synthase